MLNIDIVKSVGSAVLSDNGRMLNNFADEKGVNKFDHVPLEEILYEAKLQRERESSPEYQNTAPHESLWDLFKSHILKGKNSSGNVTRTEESTNEELTEEGRNQKQQEKGDVTVTTGSLSGSLENANRMARSASWGSIFFLITTDILGPSSAPYAISELGYVPGSLLFFLFGVVAVYTGILLWRMYLNLDSDKYPIKNYGDVVGRTCGSTTRYCIDLLQSIQLVCNVAVIILGNGQSLSQMTKGKGCYTVLILVWAIAGMIVCQIKSLQRFGFLANFAIWLNVFVIIVTMAVVAHLGPNFNAAKGTRSDGNIVPGPVATHAIIYMKNKTVFTNQLSACMNIVYSYGGAMVFIEFMSEMRRPWDFWKGMISAQAFIFVVYLIYGLFVYSQQGQFVANPANQGIADSKWVWQTVTNAVSLVGSLIAAGLYGNVGIKVVYDAFCRRILRFPSLESKFGRVIWIAAVIVYWAVAFIIAAAVPQLSSLVALVGAVCILQFSYTFPPIMLFVLSIRVGAMKGEEGYDPNTKEVSRLDSWKNISRWIRGYKQRWVLNTANFIIFLACLTTAALGIYSSAESLVDAFKQDGATSSFTCKSTMT